MKCEIEPCSDQAECVNTIPGYHCTECGSGYQGERIEGIGIEFAKNNKQVNIIIYLCFCRLQIDCKFVIDMKS